MSSADTNHQPKDGILYRYPMVLVVLTLCLICGSGSLSLAQSGRNQTPSKSETTPKTSEAGNSGKKDSVPSPAFIVVTAAPDVYQTFGNQAGSYQPPNLEYQARGGTETQASANACARYKFTQADVEMKAVYQQLMAELAGEVDKDQQRLTQAQLLWIQYRDANCESEASIYDGGSIHPAVYNTCLASMTEERTKDESLPCYNQTVAGNLQSAANPRRPVSYRVTLLQKENR